MSAPSWRKPAGMLWIFPMRRLLRWMEIGKWRE